VTLDPDLSSACYSSNVDELTPALSLPSSMTDTRAGLVSTTPTDTSIITVLRRPVLPAWFAGLQVGVVCGFPTMIFVSIVLILGTQMPILDGENPTLEYIAMSGLLDTALIALLIRVFLMLSGETSRNVFVGVRPLKGEILRVLIAIPLMMAGVAGVMAMLKAVAPWTHTVTVNPYERYMHHPIDVTILIITVVLAGGIREELQRAFILHRFQQRLGGAWVGLTIYTGIFASLHLIQGVDSAITVGLLGLCWGLMYKGRQSAVAGMVSHAGFDAAQVLLVFLAR
jgi:membrane protease YdiL (CAAX protease family)